MHVRSLSNNSSTRRTPIGISVAGWLASRPCVEVGRRLGQQLSTLERITMATYVTLYNFTDQGLKNIKDTIKRLEAAKKAGAAIGRAGSVCLNRKPGLVSGASAGFRLPRSAEAS
jgi:hypothetical protein